MQVWEMAAQSGADRGLWVGARERDPVAHKKRLVVVGEGESKGKEQTTSSGPTKKLVTKAERRAIQVPDSLGTVYNYICSCIREHALICSPDDLIGLYWYLWSWVRERARERNKQVDSPKSLLQRQREEPYRCQILWEQFIIITAHNMHLYVAHRPVLICTKKRYHFGGPNFVNLFVLISPPSQK